MFYQILLHPAIPNHHDYGYEDKYEFFKAVRQLVRKYGGRVGECIDTRHAFLLLVFTDTPNGRPVQAWLPAFMCKQTVPPAKDDDAEDDPLAGVFGEGW